MVDPKIFSGIPAPDTQDFAQLVQFCEHYRSEVLARIHWAAAEIADGLGFAEMLRIVRERGGTTWYVPQTTALPEKNASSLIRNAPQGRAELPSANGLLASLRSIAIEQAVAEGTTLCAAAKMFGVSYRGLRKKRGKDRASA